MKIISNNYLYLCYFLVPSLAATQLPLETRSWERRALNLVQQETKDLNSGDTVSKNFEYEWQRGSKKVKVRGQYKIEKWGAKKTIFSYDSKALPSEKITRSFLTLKKEGFKLSLYGNGKGCINCSVYNLSNKIQEFCFRITFFRMPDKKVSLFTAETKKLRLSKGKTNFNIPFFVNPVDIKVAPVVHSFHISFFDTDDLAYEKYEKRLLVGGIIGGIIGSVAGPSGIIVGATIGSSIFANP